MPPHHYRLQYVFVLVLTAYPACSSKALDKEDNAQCTHDFFPAKVSLLQSSSSFTSNEPIRIAEHGHTHTHVSMVAQQLRQPKPVVKDMPAPLMDLYKAGDDMIDLCFSLMLCVIICGAHLVFFACVRDRYPKVYSNNIEIGEVDELDDGIFSWISDSMSMSLEGIVEVGGLDVAMFLKTSELCGNILMTIGVPLTLTLCPLHFYGSIGMIDPMDQVGIGNLQSGSRVFWLHAIVVWVVVYVVQRHILSAQREFRDLRLQWLEELPRPRCTTVLVRGIPEAIATDIALKRFVESLFNEDSVEAAFVVRWVPDHFGEVVKKRDDCMEEMLKAKHSQSKAEAGELHRLSQAMGETTPSNMSRRRSITLFGSTSDGTHSHGTCSYRREESPHISFSHTPSQMGRRRSVLSTDDKRVSSEGIVGAPGQRMGRRPSIISASSAFEAKRSLYASEGSHRRSPSQQNDGTSSQSDDETKAKSVAALHEAQEALKQAQNELDELQEGLRDVKYGFAHDGFVTFKRRRDAEFAVSMRISFQPDELLFYEAPDPTDVRYEVFLRQGFEPTGMAILGYLSLFLIFVSYTPMVFFVAGISKVDYLRGWAFFNWLATDYHILANLWDSQLTPTLLTLAQSCMPYLLMLIVKKCFSCPSERGCQVVLQEWFFRYLIVFLLFLFTISSSLTQTWMEIVAYPAKIFELLARSLPNVMHFYMSFVPMQAVVAAGNLGRYWVFLTYLYYCQRFDEDYSRELSEPEDQDFNGMASRTARVSLIFIIALVFSSICPPICLLAYFTFLIHRVVFGYVMVFAETRKIDTGGAFWNCHIRHMQFGLAIYITTMVGIIYDKNKRASYLAGGSYALFAFLWLQLEKLLDCDRLPLEDIVRLDQHETCDYEEGADSCTNVSTDISKAQTYADASSLVLPTLYTQPHLHVRRAAMIANTIAMRMGAATNKALVKSLPQAAQSGPLLTQSASLTNLTERFTPTSLHAIQGTPRSNRNTPRSPRRGNVPETGSRSATPRQGTREVIKEETKEGITESPQPGTRGRLDSSHHQRTEEGTSSDTAAMRPPVPVIQIQTPQSKDDDDRQSKESKPKKNQNLSIPEPDQ